MLRIKRLLRKSRYNLNAVIMCALVFFAIGATAFCMVANSREAARDKEAAKQLIGKEPEEAVAAAAAVKNAVEHQRQKRRPYSRAYLWGRQTRKMIRKSYI